MEATDDPVRKLLSGQQAACEYLRKAEQISFAVDVERELSKVLVLSAASYFEHRISTAIGAMADGPADPRLSTLVRLKAVKRQYHTYFDWDNEKLGAFRTMFGDAVADDLKSRASTDEKFKNGQQAFLKIGHERNLIVHENFATYTLADTLDVWLARYDQALVFVAAVEDLLKARPISALAVPADKQQPPREVERAALPKDGEPKDGEPAKQPAQDGTQSPGSGGLAPASG